MILHLAMKNVRKSVWDYAVYFITLVIGVCVFYLFHAIMEQPVYNKLLSKGRESAINMEFAVIAANIIVSIVLACLIVYGNNFLVKRRMKEFSIYTLLGMKRREIAQILFVETIVVGVVSLVCGILLGVALSQGVSAFAAKMLEADLSEFSFAVSWGAIRRTLLYFCVIHAVVVVLDLVVVTRIRLVYLLQAQHRPEQSAIRNPKVCAVVFILAAGMLGFVYYTATAGLSVLCTPERVGEELAELVVATALMFWSAAGVSFFLAHINKPFYLRGLHMFTVREISGRFNTNVVAGTVTSFLMFAAITIVSVCFSLSVEMNRNVKKWIPVDINLQCSYFNVPQQTPVGGETSIAALLQSRGMDVELFRDPVEVAVYGYHEPETPDAGADGPNIFANREVMGIEDYNRIAVRYGMPVCSLEEDEYFVVSNRRYQMDYYRKSYLAKSYKIELCGREYQPAYTECREGFVSMNYFPDNYGITVVPQSALSDERIRPERRVFAADYNAVNEADAGRIDQYVKSDAFFEKLLPGEGKDGNLYGTYKSELYPQSVGFISLVAFVGFYLGIILFMTSAALFSLKELSQAVESKDNYMILRKLGVEQKMLRRSLFHQNLMFFGIPLLVALIHSFVGFQALSSLIIKMTDIFEGTSLKKEMFITGGLLTGVYVIYFCITYRCSRSIVEYEE